ncbi:alpha-amylase family glycosyl hydrolase [Streptomyces spinosirectus]
MHERPGPGRLRSRAGGPARRVPRQSSYYWWDAYQPYSHDLNSRFGTKARFAAMITACHGAGVKVYTDAVINHTGTNRSYTTGGSSGYTTGDTWK